MLRVEVGVESGRTGALSVGEVGYGVDADFCAVIGALWLRRGEIQ